VAPAAIRRTGGLFVGGVKPLPRRGNFLAVMGNRYSRPLLSNVCTHIDQETSLPIKTFTLPTHFTGAWSSDHWSLHD
jgi:hypothetical protein